VCSSDLQRVGVHSIKFKGKSEFLVDAADKAAFHLEGPRGGEIIAVMGLLDLYQLDRDLDFPSDLKATGERVAWATEYIEKQVGHSRYHQFFAVHETEAWLLSDPSIFPAGVKDEVNKVTNRPEQVNLANPPGNRLSDWYRRHTKCAYKKVTNGQNLFQQLNPEVAAEKCPNLKRMLDKMLELANAAIE